MSMPKVELHAHLNGSVRDSTLLFAPLSPSLCLSCSGLSAALSFAVFLGSIIYLWCFVLAAENLPEFWVRRVS